MPSNSLCAFSFCFFRLDTAEMCCLGWRSVLLRALSSVGKKFQEHQVSQKVKGYTCALPAFVILKLICGGISVSLTGSKSASTKDAARGQTESEGNQEEEANRAGHSRHGDYKKATCDDE